MAEHDACGSSSRRPRRKRSPAAETAQPITTNGAGVAAPPLGIGAALEVEYSVHSVRFLSRYVEVIFRKEDALQPGDPGYIGGVPKFMKWTTSDQVLTMPLQPGTRVMLQVVVIAPALAPPAPAAQALAATPQPALAAPADRQLVVVDPEIRADPERLALAESMIRNVGMPVSLVSDDPEQAPRRITDWADANEHLG